MSWAWEDIRAIVRIYRWSLEMFYYVSVWTFHWLSGNHFIFSLKEHLNLTLLLNYRKTHSYYSSFVYPLSPSIKIWLFLPLSAYLWMFCPSLSFTTLCVTPALYSNLRHSSTPMKSVRSFITHMTMSLFTGISDRRIKAF